MRYLLAVTCLLFPLQAAIIDRIAITVDKQVITELALDEELRVTAFLNGTPVNRDINVRRASAARLIEQLLVLHEMELSRYPLPSESDVNTYLDQVRSQFDSPSQFTQALAAYDLTDAILKDHLALQLTTLRFIEYRFRPEIGVSDADIQGYYQREIANWKSKHNGPPPTLESSREEIRQRLTDERTDQALNAWLEDARKQTNIVYLDKALQ
jgi:parvulin-like peptidyl-prolyl isomerase